MEVTHPRKYIKAATAPSPCSLSVILGSAVRLESEKKRSVAENDSDFWKTNIKKSNKNDTKEFYR